MTVSLWVWAATIAGLLVLVAIDIWHARRPHHVGFREATTWSVIYIVASIIFGVLILVFSGMDHGTEFFAGWLIEKSLSVDNLFVFAVILSTFGVPDKHQQKVLLIGILGALVMRAIFIAVGAAAIHRFAFTFVIFGAFLIYTAVKLVRSHGEQPDVGNSRAVKMLRRFIPVTDDFPENSALTVKRDGKRLATPLLVVVVTILSVDLVFALDSIPAVFGVTESPYIVFTANAFALLGLRALYFLLIGLLDRLVHLHYGLAVVLAFIGVKLILHYAHTVWSWVPEIPTAVSLAVVVLVLAVTTVTSLRATRKAQVVRSEHG
ncbi:TerC/Alx family metal homeostasis membrane protein [Cryptosporangium phraense]|uniref:TerC/Alx family metal homeostasis membrane protein n=1 Tax=Cryptosporangium phraense TaxID=2593070 RepID=A0A545AJM3_9ACTN|nr:TerC/Alx family metal homeostasis membrane protein [Cryptosporangium phraense]TQS41518.1 TerC/Alx family metal homeostasis membrane protein [Cryptosporangium phraense]